MTSTTPTTIKYPTKPQTEKTQEEMLKDALSKPGVREVMDLYGDWKKQEKNKAPAPGISIMWRYSW